jgi:hypothetical protein
MEPGLAHRPSSCSSCRLHAPPCYLAVVQFTGVLAGVSVSKSEVRRNVVFGGMKDKKISCCLLIGSASFSVADNFVHVPTVQPSQCFLSCPSRCPRLMGNFRF